MPSEVHEVVATKYMFCYRYYSKHLALYLNKSFFLWRCAPTAYTARPPLKGCNLSRNKKGIAKTFQLRMLTRWHSLRLMTVTKELKKKVSHVWRTFSAQWFNRVGRWLIFTRTPWSGNCCEGGVHSFIVTYEIGNLVDLFILKYRNSYDSNFFCNALYVGVSSLPSSALMFSTSKTWVTKKIKSVCWYWTLHLPGTWKICRIIQSFSIYLFPQ